MFGDQPDLALNRRVHALAERLEACFLAGVRAVVPAYASLLVEFDPLLATRADVERAIRAALAGAPAQDTVAAGRPRVIPVVYGGTHGPDLGAAAAASRLTPAQVVALHSEADLVVYMLGFAPGHPYLGDLPPQLALPRLTTPRERVPAGSVGIAGHQSVIYSHATPGGWHLLGRTPVTLFDARRDPPAYLRPGDRVRFRPIQEAEYAACAGTPDDW